jgi:hypothetical protein
VALQGLFAWLGYLAFEPYLRRRTPELLIGWARLLEGRFADPRVGRDILWGALLGMAGAAILHVVNGLPTWIPFQGQTTVPVMSGGEQMTTLGGLFALPSVAFVGAFTVTLFAFLLRVLLRRDGLVFAGMWIAASLITLGGENVALEAPGTIAVALLLTLAVTRFGLLATTAMIGVQLLLTSYPPLLQGSGWYAAYALVALGGVLGLLLAAFRVSLAGAPAFGGSLDA